ncbi:MAG: hypothetical protein IT460_07765 [Planctomycetes bacterium]|nr:hypothetical protein [Planctomycetota bacterium]
MNATTKVLVGLLLQLALFAFAVYVVVDADAVPGAPTATRVGLGVLAIAVAIVYGETTRLRVHLAALLRGLQTELSGTVPRDDRMAIDVLVAALESSDPAKRDIAHRNLVRLTKQDLPPDGARWKAWWRDARATWPSTPTTGA